MHIYFQHMLLYVIPTFLLFKKISRRKTKKIEWAKLSGREDDSLGAAWRTAQWETGQCSEDWIHKGSGLQFPHLSEHFHVSHQSLKEVFLCSFPPTKTTFLLWTHVKIMTFCQPRGIYLEKGGPEGAATFLPSILESWSRCGWTTVGIFCSP